MSSSVESPTPTNGIHKDQQNASSAPPSIVAAKRNLLPPQEVMRAHTASPTLNITSSGANVNNHNGMNGQMNSFISNESATPTNNNSNNNNSSNILAAADKLTQLKTTNGNNNNNSSSEITEEMSNLKIELESMKKMSSQVQSDYKQVQTELSDLKKLHEEQMKKMQKRLNDLINEIDDEKKTRLALQVELERLKKTIANN
jgi:chromosome segregation ATPase